MRLSGKHEGQPLQGSGSPTEKQNATCSQVFATNGSCFAGQLSCGRIVWKNRRIQPLQGSGPPAQKQNAMCSQVLMIDGECYIWLPCTEAKCNVQPGADDGR
jgi:hypothetical protein